MLTTAAVLTAWVPGVWAAPPHPRLWESSESGRALYAQTPPDSIRPNARFQPDGVEYVLVLRVDFPDKPGTRTRAQLDGLLFNEQGLSLASYFREVSYGRMRVQPAAGDGSYPRADRWYRMPQAMRVYGEGRINLARYLTLVEDACNAADGDVDFRRYDRDADGILDHLVILHSGDDEAATGAPDDIWSILVPNVNRAWDGVRVQTAVVIAEEPSAPTPHMGIWFHEFLHDFGAPETYVTGTLVAANDQQYCLMGLFGPYQGNGPARDGTQPAHVCGYLKWDMDGIPENGRHGWITPIQLDRNMLGVSIPAFSSPEGVPPLYKVDLPGKQGREFFLIENRSRKVARFDTGIPDEGLIIWHVDESKERSSFSVAARLWVEDPADPLHENLTSTITQDAAYAAEDGQTAFTPATKPSTDANDGSSSGISVLDIGKSGPKMTFNLFFGDTYEPNNSLAEASPVAIGGRYDSFLFDDDDRVDFYRLAVPGGARLRVEARFLGDGGGLRLGLRDAHGELLSTGRPMRRLPGVEGGVEVLYFSSVAQTLYVELSASGRLSFPFPYSLSVLREDDSVGRNAPRFVEVAAVPNPAPRGQPVRIRVSLASAGVEETTLEVFDASGARIGRVEARHLDTGDSVLEFVPAGGGSLSPGVYFALVTARQQGQAATYLTRFAVE
jgi:M6 family metalloprotease-like protein